MLVLSRKAKQRIQIGENISITVLRVKGQGVRIGIDAPPEIRVRRSELTAFESSSEKDATTEDRGLSQTCRTNSKAGDRHKNVQRLPSSSDFRRVEDPFVCHGRSSSAAAQR